MCLECVAIPIADNCIAKKVTSRSATDCRIRWMTCEEPSVNKSEWTKEEEDELVNLTKKYKGHDWVAIARELGVSVVERNPSPFC